MKHLDELRRLKLPRDKFAIFGSGCLAIRNIRDNNDLDIIVKPELWEHLIKKYPRTKKSDFIQIDNIEIYKDLRPWVDDSCNLIDSADIIRGFRFVKLKYIIQLKKAMNRKKDKEDIKLIENFLKHQK
ncbi:MAG: hypothetical protein J7K31_03685 [Candidatus Aenigmarchaeota archaeon]|nr:hypothetical protein [Candidatus Aenigmarchaeota archaeon]